jgi:hypothetical protein
MSAEAYDTSHLSSMLVNICMCDELENYDLRNLYIMDAEHIARHIGYPTGIRCDPAEPDWPVIYIELPTGQVSWHVPAHSREWDGHTTAQKIARIKLFVECAAPMKMRAFEARSLPADKP